MSETENPVCPEKGILVKVVASSVNPVDFRLINGHIRFSGKKLSPWIPGSDFSGLVVESCHPDFNPEDEVYGMVDPVKGGSFAELIAVRPENLEFKPGTLSFHQAAAIPLAGLTCFQALVRVGKIKTGDHVMIHGCTGGVGSMAVLLARALHAKVTGTCSSTSVEFAKKIGVEYIIDYMSDDPYQPQRYDLIFDVHGSLNYRRIKKMLKPGGKFICLRMNVRNIARVIINRVTGAHRFFLVSVRPSRKGLKWLSEFVDRRRITPQIFRIIGLDQLPEIRHLYEGGHVNGKVIISI